LQEKGPLWLLESAADAMFIADPAGRIVHANAAALALFGHSSTEFLELAVEDLIPARFRAGHAAQRRDYAVHPGSRAMGAGLELYGLRKDGSEFAADVSLSPLADGHVLATVHDISRRKYAESALAEKTARLAAIVETAVDAIITIDECGLIDSFNPAAERLFGYTREEVLGRNVSMLMPSPHREQHDGYLAHYLSSGEKRVIGIGREVMAQRKDGTTFPIELAVSEMQVGKRRMFTGLVHDITLRKQAEEHQARLIHELESANEELKNFAYVVSHDLKAPLRAIGSLADWIAADQSEKLDADGKEHLRLLIQRARRMDGLIDGILQYSRVGRVRETVVEVDVNDIVREALAMLAPPPHIKVEVAPNLPVIRAERTRILQLFQNLLSNAIKYMDKPEGLIRVACADHVQEWEFSVSDNGPGIEPRHFKRIFQLFQTLAPRDRVESTGVGLALVKKIVELYGGRVWVESQTSPGPSAGSTFFLTLPKSGTT
jgi:two-component system sensor kinase FixL